MPIIVFSESAIRLDLLRRLRYNWGFVFDASDEYLKLRSNFCVCALIESQRVKLKLSCTFFNGRLHIRKQFFYAAGASSYGKLFFFGQTMAADNNYFLTLQFTLDYGLVTAN